MICTSTHTTPSKTFPSASVRRSARRSATRPESDVLQAGSFPLDEALVDVAIDLSGRPFAAWNVELPECLPLGNPPFDPQLAEHAVSSFATAAAITLHVNKRAGTNVHHIIEATFKGVARCLRDAVRVETTGVPSTKGTL